MRTDAIQQAVDNARNFIEMAAFIEEHYGKYHDGRGFEHYVSGPACAQLREVARDLAYELNDLRRHTAAKLPAIPMASESKAIGFTIDLETLSQPGWHTVSLVEFE